LIVIELLIWLFFLVETLVEMAVWSLAGAVRYVRS